MFNSLRSHESQHARSPCPTPVRGGYSNSCPLSRWCHTAISSSVFPFSSCPQLLPTTGSFPMGQLFASGGQSIGASTSAAVHAMNIQGWSPLRLTGLISPWCPRDFPESSPTPQFKSINSSALSLLYGPTLTSIHDYWKNHRFDYMELWQQSDVPAFKYCLDLS